MIFILRTIKKAIIKPFLIIFTTLLFVSCQKDSCSFPDYDLVRQINIPLNDKAKNSLNNICKILDGTRGINIEYKTPNIAKVQRNEVYFKLSENEQILYFETVYYKDESQLQVSHYFSYKVPLKEMSPDNIEININNYPTSEGVYASIEFESNFKNPDAFQIKKINYDKNEKPNGISCMNSSSFYMNFNVDDAQKLKEEFIKFLNSYKVK